MQLGAGLLLKCMSCGEGKTLSKVFLLPVQCSAVYCEECSEEQRAGEMANTLMEAKEFRVHLGTVHCKVHSTSIQIMFRVLC